MSHRVSFPGAANHYAEVESRFPATGSGALELMMAVWTPGSYLVREYSRNLENVAAFDPGGRPLPIAKTRKNRWRVEAGGAGEVTIRYRIYAAELSVRTSWVGADMAVLNGAATFLAPVGDLAAPHDISFQLPAGWRETVTALPPHPSGEPHRYLAPDYDTLVDSPVLLGNPVVRRFEVGGIRHRLAHLGDTGLWDADRAARDVARLVEVQRAFWRQLPYTSYDFLSVLVDTGSGGGLEHRGSTLLLSNPAAMRKAADYSRWLAVVSHEFFHAWNVKRLRPIELGPFDYENEVYTRSLWIAEGVTSYYDELLLLRAGLVDRTRYLAALSQQIRDVETVPGRWVQPLALSSFDAWIKFYRPDENSTNAAINYYDKGAVVGFLLDTEIRRATEGQRSLDDVMRAAYDRFAGARGYRPEEFRQVAEDVARRDLGRFWADSVDGAAPLDYQPALDYYGLRFVSRPSCSGCEAAESEPPATLGLDAKSEAGRLLVTRVVRDGAAWAAGVQAGDEIIAIDERRVPPDGLNVPLARYEPGDRVTLLVARWNVLLRLPVELGRRPTDRFDLEPTGDPSPAQRARLAAWLSQGG